MKRKSDLRIKVKKWSVRTQIVLIVRSHLVLKNSQAKWWKLNWEKTLSSIAVDQFVLQKNKKKNTTSSNYLITSTTNAKQRKSFAQIVTKSWNLMKLRMITCWKIVPRLLLPVICVIEICKEASLKHINVTRHQPNSETYLKKNKLNTLFKLKKINKI